MASTKQTMDLNDPDRLNDIRSLIHRKKFLKQFYEEIYNKFRDCLQRAPIDGIALELGSGAGFIKDIIPEIITSDVIPYKGIDKVVDATKMPFADEGLRAILMFDVFHHIRDVEAFFNEAHRCLKPGGRIFIVDEYAGLISYPIYKYLHHEPYNAKAKEWRFESKGPLSDANGALSWIVFQRDQKKFQSLFPGLKVVNYEPHSPLRYWIAGGLKKWALAGEKAFPLVTRVDRLLTKISPRFGSFVDIEIVRA